MSTTAVDEGKPDALGGRQRDVRRWVIGPLSLVATITLVGCSGGDVQGDVGAEGDRTPTSAEPGATAQEPNPGGEEAGSAAPTPGPPVETLTHIHGLQIPTWGDGDVYVSTHQGAFRIGSDGDWTWVSEQPHDFMGFAAHPTDEGVLYSSGHPAQGSDLANPIGFMVSTDAGASWQPRSLQGEVDFHVMAVHPQDGDIIYGFDGRRGLLHTSDGGERWDELSSPALAQTPPAGLAVGAGDGDLYAATEGGLLHSSDGGASWRQLLERPVTAVHVDVSDPQRLLAYAADGQGLLRSEDGGASWESLGLTLGEDAASHVAVAPGDPNTVWVGSFGQSLWHTTDGGQRWNQPVTAGTRTDG